MKTIFSSIYTEQVVGGYVLHITISRFDEVGTGGHYTWSMPFVNIHEPLEAAIKFDECAAMLRKSISDE